MRRNSKVTRSKRTSQLRQLESLEDRNLLAADLVSVSPAPDDTFVDPAADIVLTFDEDVSVGSGNITIQAGGTTLETIDVSDAAKVTISGNTVTINPAANLPTGSTITVAVDEGAIGFQSVAVFSEGFEDVNMLPFESDTEGGGDGTDWSDELPSGWVKDNTDTPDGGPIEFFGMTIMDKNSWIATAGNQDRDAFTKGTGNVIVADGDEYDDGGASIGPDLMNVFLTTPEIDLSAIAANTAVLEFDSSVRPEVDQTAIVEVSYDDGDTWTNLLSLNETNIDGGRSSLARANARERLPLNNPEGATALIRFGYINAGNNWWWAFDNVAVEIPGAGESSAATEWSFNTALDVSPAINATGVSTTGNLSVTFSQDVVLTPGLGNVDIHRADGTLFESIPVSSSRVTASGATVTIDPVKDLEADTEYQVTIDDFSIWDTANVSIEGITLFSEDFDDLTLEDSGLTGGLDINHYVMVVTGVLDVTEAGTYTFGTNSDDGQRLAVDVAQDGLDIIDDEIIYDDTIHGTEVRLSTCYDVDLAAQACVDEGDPGIELAVGEYAFEYWYFEGDGGSSGEFFYGPGSLEEFDADSFVLVGDSSKGIGVTADGITATIYVSALEDATLDTITSFERAELLVEGEIARQEGFPASATIATADIWSTGSVGLFNDNNPLPGFEPPEPDPDWSPLPPEGWTKDTSFLEENKPGGPAEYLGWNFLQKDFWVAEQGNQNRTDFELGQNVLALVDPDAYDDFVNIDADGGDTAAACEPLEAADRTAGGDCGYFSAGLSTPPFNLAGLDPNSANLTFDSSWRDETTQSAEATVEFFDADGNAISSRQLFRWESMASDPNYKAAATNETINIPLQNPAGATSAVVTFTMPYAQNDWWWAIDNVRLTSPFSGNPLPGIKPGQWTFSTGEGGGGQTLVGDIDGDNTVGFSDFLILSRDFGKTVDPGTGADLDGGGKVDFADFLLLSANFGATLNPPPPSQAVAAADMVFAMAMSDDADDEGLSLEL